MKIKTEEGRKLFIRVISDKKAAKLDFSGAVKEGMEADALKKQACLALSKKGKAYGVYEEQKLIGLFLFERKENFFTEQTGQGELAELQKLFMESTAAAVPAYEQLPQWCEPYRKKMEEYLETNLKEQVEWGIISGYVYQGQLTYRAALDEKQKKKVVAGYLLGFVVGMLIGGLVMDSLALGIGSGMSFAVLYGCTMMASSSDRCKWENYDFVKQDETKEQEDA